MGVLADQHPERCRREFEVLLGQAVLAQLARHQKLLGDVHLLVFGVSGKPDDLHAVAQRRDDGVDHVRCRNKQHLRQVVGHFQVVIREVAILLGVEDLEQRR